MGVYLQPSRPFYLIEFEYRGHRYRKSSETKSKPKAQEIERTWRAELKDQHHLGKVPDHTWGEAVSRYYQEVIVPKDNPKSAKLTLFVLAKLRGAFGTDTKLIDVTSGAIGDYKATMHATGAALGTVNKHLAYVKAILRRCANDWHWLPVVPRIKLEKLNNEGLAWVTKEQEAALLPHLPEWLKDLVVFLIDTGARLGEATGLTWANLELDRQPRAIVKFMKTKNNEPRGVPLTKRCEALLRKLKARNAKLDVVAADRDVVFLKDDPFNTKKDAATKDQWRRITQPFQQWKAALKKASLSEDLRLHDLRHTFASRLVIARVPILDVSKLLGHKSIKMTMRYAHLAPDSLGSAIAVLDGPGL